jgi:putative acetyltransferase
MMAQPSTSLVEKRIRVRRFAAGDIEAMMNVFRDSVRFVASRDYTPEQVMAWAPDVMDREAWAPRYTNQHTWIAELDRTPVGFAVLEPDGHLDKMYVHSAYQRRGVAAALLERIEIVAREIGLIRLYTEASITGRPFFERLGFNVIAPQTIQYNGQHFINFQMQKPLRTY